MSEAILRTRRWTRVEYDRLIDKGVFQPDERLELLAGHLVVREPQGDPHILAIERLNEVLRGAFGPEWRVRIQLPIALDDRKGTRLNSSHSSSSHADFSLKKK